MQGDKGTWIGRGVGPPGDRIRAGGGHNQKGDEGASLASPLRPEAEVAYDTNYGSSLIVHRIDKLPSCN